MADECIFCRIIKGDILTKLYEDDVVLAFLDIGPLNEGHCLLIPKAHYSRLDQCPASVLQSLVSYLPQLAQAVVQAVRADGYNVLNNNGRTAGQLVDHVHFHIIPRFEGDGVLAGWPAKKYQPGRMETVAQTIRNLLK